jgi:hypothetical protein
MTDLSAAMTYLELRAVALDRSQPIEVRRTALALAHRRRRQPRPDLPQRILTNDLRAGR